MLLCAMKRILFFFLLSTIAFAQKFTIEQVMSAPHPNQLVVAKKATRVAWVFNDRGEENIWVADGAEWQGRRLTSYQGDNGMPIAALTITPDGKTVIFSRGSETTGKDSSPTRPHKYARPSNKSGLLM